MHPESAQYPWSRGFLEDAYRILTTVDSALMVIDSAKGAKIY